MTPAKDAAAKASAAYGEEAFVVSSGYPFSVDILCSSGAVFTRRVSVNGRKK